MFAIVPLMIVTYLTAISIPSARGNEETVTTSETQELGKVINLGKTNLLKDFKEKETSIFESFPPECFKKEKLNSTEKTKFHRKSF